MLLPLMACAAVHPVPGSGSGTVGAYMEGQLSIEVPRGWTLDQNRQSFGNTHLLLSAPRELSTQITVDLVREGSSTRALDLMIVSEAYALDHGRNLEIEARVIGHHQLEVDGHEAWAVTTLRRHGPHERLASTVVLRGQTHLAILTLHTLPENSAAVATDWGVVLDSFSLGEPVDPDAPPFLRDAEMERALDEMPW